MENPYMRSSYIFAGKTPHFLESPTISEYSSLQALSGSVQGRQDLSFSQIRSDALFSWSLNDEYLGSTSPYDDDGN
jgi:hypothetical protein